jgi:hypothetical protein
MRPGTQGEMLARIRPPDIETIGIAGGDMVSEHP